MPQCSTGTSEIPVRCGCIFSGGAAVGHHERGGTVTKLFLTALAVCLPYLCAAQSAAPEMKKDPVPAAVQARRDTLPAKPAAAVPAARDTMMRARALSAPRDTAVMRWNEDSLIAARTATSDTVMRGKKSTTFAMLSSMVLPGAGQIYNESYWKAPVVWGFGAYFYSAFRTQNKKYKQSRDQYAASVAADTAGRIGDLNIRDIRNFYRSERDRFGMFMVITYLITVVDAYVDASLFNFEVSPDLQPHGEWKATLHVRLR